MPVNGFNSFWEGMKMPCKTCGSPNCNLPYPADMEKNWIPYDPDHVWSTKAIVNIPKEPPFSTLARTVEGLQIVECGPSPYRMTPAEVGLLAAWVHQVSALDDKLVTVFVTGSFLTIVDDRADKVIRVNLNYRDPGDLPTFKLKLREAI